MQDESLKQKLQKFFLSLRVSFGNFFKKNRKRKIVLCVVVIVLLFLILKPKGIDKNLITVVPVQTQNLVSAVKASGKVTSIVDLNLSFKTPDMVNRINVEVGDKVKKGQVLATLESGNESAAVTQAQGGLRSAQATLQKTKEGATTEELRVTQTAYDNALRDYEKTKKSQDSLVQNARRALYSQYLEATPDSSSTVVAPTISGSYGSDKLATYKVSVYSTGSGAYYSVSGPSSISGPLDFQTPKPLGSEGLFITFPSGFSTDQSNWTVNVPNTSSTYYTANYNAYLSAKESYDLALSQAQAVLDARQADLDLKKAGARTTDVEIAEANVLVAQGAYQNAVANLEKKILRSPADGTVTRVDIKVGEQANALTPVIVVQDISKLYIEADINESSIRNVQIGQNVDFTIDAFGSGQFFKGAVTQVEPSATVADGIVNYKIKASIEGGDGADYKNIKPGMNANIVITTGTKESVIAIPGAAIEKTEGKNLVRVITNEKKKSFVEREVVVGIVGDGNMTEITSGLVAGESVALVEKK